tara:strand:- start:1123 stop:1374 length:252 start_codon:yes stop_codon:yes gene_type:complete
MITIVSNEKLNFLLSLNTDNNELIDGLTDSYIEKYGQDSYTISKVIIVTSEKVCHVIKNVYNLPEPYLLTSDLQEYIENYINL